MKDTAFPRVRASSEFREQILKACQSLNLKYSSLVTLLLEQWLSGKLELKISPDEEFIEAAHAAILSNRGQKALKQFAKHYDPNREYPDAISI